MVVIFIVMVLTIDFSCLFPRMKVHNYITGPFSLFVIINKNICTFKLSLYMNHKSPGSNCLLALLYMGLSYCMHIWEKINFKLEITRLILTH